MKSLVWLVAANLKEMLLFDGNTTLVTVKSYKVDKFRTLQGDGPGGDLRSFKVNTLPLDYYQTTTT
jgi:hypothetical protein